jgi:hypothetical protein
MSVATTEVIARAVIRCPKDDFMGRIFELPSGKVELADR